jgi:glycine betaine/proline transport system ATP-binding protein
MKDGYVVQVGTPEEILTNPANDYVKAFVQNVDRTKIITANAIMRKAPTVQASKDGPSVAIRKMEKTGVSTTYVVDEKRNLKGIVTIDDAVELKENGGKDLSDIINADIEVAGPDTPINALLTKSLQSKYPIAVVNEEGKLLGIVDRATILAELNENGSAQSEENENKYQLSK